MNNKIKQEQVWEPLSPCKKRAPPELYVQRDFALKIPERLEGTRGSLVTNPRNMQDPVERNMVDPLKAMLTRNEQDATWFSESWEDVVLWTLCNLLH
jgi:hypothetical protein